LSCGGGHREHPGQPDRELGAPARDVVRVGDREGGTRAVDAATAAAEQVLRTGVIYKRSYRCTDARHALRRHPAWNAPAGARGSPDA
jgi:hypothetical protein